MGSTVDFLEIWGHVFAIGMTLILLYTYVCAYSSPDKSVIVNVNYYGEAVWEPYLLGVAFVLAVSGWIIWFKRLMDSGGNSGCGE